MTTSLTAEDILLHPRFEEARRAHIDAAVALFTGNRVALRMMSDVGLILFRGFLFGFHVAFEPGDPATWATPGNVKRALVERGLASPRRVDALLSQFRQAGYLTAAPSPGDRRTQLLVPTELLVAHDRAHLAAYHRFLLVLFPGRGYEWVLGEDDEAHRAIRRAAFRDLGRATSALQHEALRLFLAHDAGYLALLLVAQAQLSARNDLTWTVLSGTLGVARSHLRTLFTQAEKAGYVRLRPEPGRPIELLPPLWSAYDRFLAGVEADQDVLAQVAFAALARG